MFCVYTAATLKKIEGIFPLILADFLAVAEKT
jgi:hypothetical protein